MVAFFRILIFSLGLVYADLYGNGDL